MILPKNKGLFKKLIEFTKQIIKLCKDNGIEPVIYGSFAHFYYTKDKSLNVNDIDMTFSRKNLQKIIGLLKKNRIKFERCSSKDYSIVVRKGKLILELDEAGGIINEEALSGSNLKKIDFYGIKVKMITLRQLEEIYALAYLEANKTKQKVIMRIKSFEKSMGRKIKMDTILEVKKNKNLSRGEQDFINKNRIKEFNDPKDFKKDYEPETLWFFLKNQGKVVALGGLRPITVKYLGKTYKIRGICSIISIIKGKGYGKYLMSFMVDYSRTTGKTILGFTGKTEFFKKAYLDTKKNFIRRFIYKNPKTGEEVIDRDGDGTYYEGKDKLISKVLAGKKPVYINVLHW